MYEKPEKYDFSGYVTRNDIRCIDGRTIRKDAFIQDDGEYVPLVWNHEHQTPFDVLGKVYLENRDDGVYGYGICNDTEAGRQAKDLICHGDIDRLSINAGRLKQVNGNVLHGKIREVSLVHSGANDGAFIDFVDLSHSDDPDYETEAFIYADCPIELSHADTQKDVSARSKRQPDELNHDDDPDKLEEDDEMDVEKEFNEAIDSLSDEQQAAVKALLDGIEAGEITAEDFESDEAQHSDEFDAITEVLSGLDERQLNAVSALISVALEDAEGVSHSDDYEDDEEYDEEEDEGGYDEEDYEDEEYEEDEDLEDEGDYEEGEYDEEKYDEEDPEYYDEAVGFAHSDEGEYDMKYNAFEAGENFGDDGVYTLSHADKEAIIEDAMALGSLKKSFLQHADDDEEYVAPTYGIGHLDFLFPDAKNVHDGAPDFIQRDMKWVAAFMGKTHKAPFGRIKSIHANITEQEARAKGYTKGNLKMEEVFNLLKRVTSPTTVYKKQKFDRDDTIDATTFDFVPWVKSEMQVMLREEVAVASLIGDGRSSSSPDKIKEDCIRPIATDDTLYNTKITIARGQTDTETTKNIINGIIRSRKHYKGSGNPILFTTEDWLTEMLLLEDGIGHKLYKTEAELATALRCSSIETVQPMEGRTVDSKDLVGVYLNPVDYTHGTDRAGETHFFDDFDIDYNQNKYLYETRLSGALTKPYGAVTILLAAATQSGGSDSGSGSGSGTGTGGSDSGSGTGTGGNG